MWSSGGSWNFKIHVSWDSHENLGMHCVVAKFVLYLPSEDQKQNRVNVSTQYVNRANADENFWLWGHNSLWISTSWPDGEQEILFEGDEKAERGGEEIRAWFVEGKKLWLRQIAPFWSAIFSQNTRWCSSPSLHNHKTLHQWTSSSSTSWNLYWKDDNLSLSRWLKKSLWKFMKNIQEWHELQLF